MIDRYSWQDVKAEPAYRSSGNDHLGWWAAAAMLVSILLHVVVFFALDQVKFALGIEASGEIVTERMKVREVEQMPMDFTHIAPPEETSLPPLDTKKLIDDLDIQDALKDQEIDLKPQVVDPEYALRMADPKVAGDPDAVPMEVSIGLDVNSDLPEPGRTKDDLKPAALGQMTVDPGSMKADDSDLTKFTDDLIKNGAGGNAADGSLDGVTSLDDLIGLPANELMGKKTLLPSDLLFEFNKYELRESAKFGLQKLGLLIDNNPAMYCWIEGHTDLIGGDAANLELSRKRAEAVKDYLVRSMGMDAEKIITRGFGRFEPIVVSGDRNQQSPNRRVEIKMRKTLPADDQIKLSPPKAPRVEEAPPPTEAPPKAVRIKPDPARAVPVEVLPMPEPEAPKALPIEEPVTEAIPTVPKAIQVTDEPEVLRAQPVPE